MRNLKRNLLTIYSPSYAMHVLVLGLLDDVIVIFEKDISQKNKQVQSVKDKDIKQKHINHREITKLLQLCFKKVKLQVLVQMS